MQSEAPVSVETPLQKMLSTNSACSGGTFLVLALQTERASVFSEGGQLPLEQRLLKCQ